VNTKGEADHRVLSIRLASTTKSKIIITTPSLSRITQDEMRELMINASERLAGYGRAFPDANVRPTRKWRHTPLATLSEPTFELTGRGMAVLTGIRGSKQTRASGLW